MKTIKLPIQNKINVSEYQRQFNSVLRWSYNRLQEGKSEKECRHLSKTLNNISLMKSWMIHCAIRRSHNVVKSNTDKRKIIFGGKHLFKQLSKNKISKQEWKEQRLLPIYIEGEAPQRGNRLFKLDVIKNNIVIFKPNKNTKISIQLPKLRKNIKHELEQIELLACLRKIPYTISLSHDYICIIFDETKLKTIEPKHVNDRIASVDLNPNYIGLVIKDHKTNNIFHKTVINLKELNDIDNQHKGLASNNIKRKKHNNKVHHEIINVSKYISKLCYHYGVKYFVVEDLNIKSSNKGKGKKFNRLVNNTWKRNKFIENITKRCNELSIKVLSIYPQYSSVIGCLEHPNEVDSIAASIELNRRGNEYRNKNFSRVMYPVYDKNSLLNKWKDETMKSVILSSKTWKELHENLKKSKLKYKFLFENCKDFREVLRLNSWKSCIKRYKF